jgi:hypothetical protein
MYPLYPETLTFSVFSDQVPKPSVTILRDGTIKPKNPSLDVQDATVLMEGDDDSVDITARQYRAMLQLVRVALHHNPSARIIFNGGASPWGLDSFPDFEFGTTVAEAMRMRPTNIKRVLMHRRPLHPVIKRKRRELASSG